MSTFEDSGLNPDILKGIAEMGFEKPMPIQEKVIEAMLDTESDLIGLAQTGTGKTAAFGLPMIHLADPSSKKTQAIVLTPTRELCIQVASDIEKYSKYVKGVNCLAVYGGTSIDPQIKALSKGVQIIVGTPGRTHDLIRRRKIDISQIRTVVLDEADEMLSMGFKEELDAILDQTPSERQTLLFSATMPKEIAEIAEKYMRDPIEIAIGKRNVGSTNVKHDFYIISARDRYPVLKRLADINPDIYGIVFCRTREETKTVAEKLIKDGYNADALHGDLSQAQRDQVMKRFRAKTLQMLVATDVAARGLDVTELTHVINYNLPDELETYIHRSGRTGRAGNNGVSIAIIHSREKHKIKALEQKINQPFERKMIPNGASICEKQLFNLIDKMENVKVDDARIEQYLLAISKKLEALSREDLIKRFVSVEFNRFLNYYKNAPDLNVNVREDRKGGSDSNDWKDKKGRRDKRDRNDRSDRKERYEKSERGERSERSERFDRSKRSNSDKSRSTQSGYSRFFLNIGSQKGLEPQNLIGLINDTTNERGMEIGKIDIMKNFSFFEVEASNSEKILKSFKNANYQDQKVSVELAQPKDTDRKDSGRRDFKKRDDKKSGSKFKGKRRS